MINFIPLYVILTLAEGHKFRGKGKPFGLIFSHTSQRDKERREHYVICHLHSFLLINNLKRKFCCSAEKSASTSIFAMKWKLYLVSLSQSHVMMYTFLLWLFWQKSLWSRICLLGEKETGKSYWLNNSMAGAYPGGYPPSGGYPSSGGYPGGYPGGGGGFAGSGGHVCIIVFYS